MKQQAKDVTVDPGVAVQIRGLEKVYAGATELGCCKCKRTSAYHAVRVKA